MQPGQQNKLIDFFFCISVSSLYLIWTVQLSKYTVRECGVSCLGHSTDYIRFCGDGCRGAFLLHVH